MKTPRLLRLARRSGLVLVALILAACGSPTASISPSTAPSAAASIPDASSGHGFQPSFAGAPCPDDVASVVVNPPTCG